MLFKSKIIVGHLIERRRKRVSRLFVMANFLPIPAQSVGFAAHPENVPPPNAVTIADLAIPATMTGHKRVANGYLENIKRLRLTTTGPDVDDLQEAVSYQIGVEVGAIIGVIPIANQAGIVAAINASTAASIVAINAQTALITALQNQFTEQTQRSDALIFNGTARSLDDALIPPHMVGQPVPPLAFPVSLNGILALNVAQCTLLEAYYALPNAGLLPARRAAIRRVYGAPRTVQEDI